MVLVLLSKVRWFHFDLFTVALFTLLFVRACLQTCTPLGIGKLLNLVRSKHSHQISLSRWLIGTRTSWLCWNDCQMCDWTGFVRQHPLRSSDGYLIGMGSKQLGFNCYHTTRLVIHSLSREWSLFVVIVILLCGGSLQVCCHFFPVCR